ncbi:MAG: InlB B-repeat-containing protein [Lachnospiraceae bacterium]|nr:InlB B-repeat-containing protein [Lachnospiraceae bacterium]
MKEKNELRTYVSLHILRRKALAFALAFALVLSTIITMVPMLEVKAEETWEYPTSAPENPFDGGDGSAENPYKIATAQQLANLAWLIKDYSGNRTYGDGNKYFKLTDNIDLGNKEWSTRIGGNNYFQGVFDGNGKTVSGLYVSGNEDNVGLFGKTKNAEIKNLTVSGSVTGNYYVGGIVGDAYTDSVIRNCTNLCEVSGTMDVGGVVGKGWDTSIYNCENIGNVTGIYYIGGICGENYSSKKEIYILDCSNYGDITYDNGNYGGQAGGICGSFSGKSCSCSGCYNSGNVTCKYGTAGGIIGNFSGTIEKCYNTGTIKVLGYSSGAYVGGIVGEMHKNISNCYNRGGVIYEGTDNYAEIGGIAGGCYPSSNNVYSNCYNMGTVQGSSNSTRIGGIVGKLSSETVTFNNNYSLSGTNSYLIEGSSTTATNQYEFLTTDEFTLAVKFNSWDFENIWMMNASNTYPVLRGVGEAEGSYTVTFNSNGGTTVAEQSVIKNKRARVPNAPIKDGYAFIGWCSDEGLNTLYDFSTAVTENKTLYAKWQLYVPDVSATGYNGEYDGNNHGITVTAPTGATITYGETEGSYATDNPSYTNVGENTVYYQVTKDGYAPVTGSATVTITEKEIGISWTDTALTYNGSEQKPTATATGLIGSDTCTITVTGQEINANVGEATYTATAESIDNANYKLPTANTTTFTISPASVTVSGITASNKSYDGNTKATLNCDDAEFDGVIGSDVLTVTATGTFEDSKPGQDKMVNITGLTLGGTSAANYVLAADGQQESTTANITIGTETITETINNTDGSTTVIKTEYVDGALTGSTETTTSEDGKTVTVEEKDASDVATKTTETVTNADGTKTVTITEGNTTTVETKDSEGNVTKTVETVTNTDGSSVITETSYDDDGNVTGTKETTVDKDGEVESVVEKDADGNIIESGDDDNQGDDNQGDDNQGDDNQGDDNQGDDSQGDDKQGDDNQGDDKQGDDKQGYDKQSDDKQGDDKQGDDKQGDDKQSDDKQGDDKQGDDKQGDDKQSDDKPSDDKQGNDKQSDDKPSDDKKDDTKSDDVKPATQKAAEVMESSEKFAEFEGETFYKNEEGDVYCIDGDGNLIRDAFVCDGTYTYYVQYDYSAMRDRLTYHPDGEHIIYFDSEGHEVFNDFAHVKHSIAGDEVDDYCFFDVYGHLYVDVITWDNTGTVLYYANPYGVMEMNKWFQFSDTVVWGDGTPTEGIAGGYGYANEDGTLMKDQYTYDWEGRFCYMQGNGTALY